MISSHTHARVRIGTINAARYLLMTHPPEQFHIEFQNDDSIQNYLLHLSNEKTWAAYKNYMLIEIKKIKKELSELGSSQVLYTQTKKHLDQLLLQEKNTQQIDTLIRDGKLQASLILKDDSESVSAMDDMIHQSLEQKDKLDTMENVGHFSASLKSKAEILRSIPFIHDFIRGLYYLREAYHAFRDSKTPQRKTKMASVLLGGLISIVAIVAGFLLLSTAGLGKINFLVFAMPIVIISLAVGVYSVALYHDRYVLNQAQKQINNTKNEIREIDSEMTEIREVIISNYLDRAQLTGSEEEIKIIQQAIEKAREELIHYELILQDAGLHEMIMTKFYGDPQLAGFNLRHTNLLSALNQLIHARDHARVKVVMNAVSCLAVVSGLAVVCMRGTAARYFFVAGVVLLVGATLAKMWVLYQEKRKK